MCSLPGRSPALRAIWKAPPAACWPRGTSMPGWKANSCPPPPADTMCGALVQYLTTENKNFQPMGANMGILPPLPEDNRPRDKRLRYMAQAERAVASFQQWLDETAL